MSAYFIHVPRTGGTTIWNHTNLPKIMPFHGTARFYKGRIQNWDKLFTFAFVRNPYERAVSWWLHGTRCGAEVKFND